MMFSLSTNLFIIFTHTGTDGATNLLLKHSDQMHLGHIFPQLIHADADGLACNKYTVTERVGSI